MNNRNVRSGGKKPEETVSFQPTASVFDINFKELFFLLLRRLWAMILAFAIVFGGWYYFKEMPKRPYYTARATMFVSNSGDTKNYYSAGDTYNAQALIETCGVVIKTDRVVSEVSEVLGGKYSDAVIRSSISVSSVSETEVMEIKCTTDDPVKSADICNAVLQVVPSVLKERIKVGAAEILDTASVPTAASNLPSFHDPFVYGLLAAAIVAAGIVISYLLDTRIRSKEEITAQYGIPILSEIPNFTMRPKEKYRSYYEYKE